MTQMTTMTEWWSRLQKSCSCFPRALLFWFGACACVRLECVGGCLVSVGGWLGLSGGCPVAVWGGLAAVSCRRGAGWAGGWPVVSWVGVGWPSGGCLAAVGAVPWAGHWLSLGGLASFLGAACATWVGLYVCLLSLCCDGLWKTSSMSQAAPPSAMELLGLHALGVPLGLACLPPKLGTSGGPWVVCSMNE